MADWDQNSPTLFENINRVECDLEFQSAQRTKPTLALIKAWHRDTMVGLTVPNPAYVGNFRGEPGAVGVGIVVGRVIGVLGEPDFPGYPGLHSTKVAAAVSAFEKKLQGDVAALDKRYPVGANLNVVGFETVIALAAWAHSEWVRMHPFANGNGRTARYLANFILARYDIGPVVRVRPRPGGDCEAAAVESMTGNHAPTIKVFVQMIADYSSVNAQVAAAAAHAPKVKSTTAKKP